MSKMLIYLTIKRRWIILVLYLLLGVLLLFLLGCFRNAKEEDNFIEEYYNNY